MVIPLVAVEMAIKVRAALEQEGIQIAPFARRTAMNINYPATPQALEEAAQARLRIRKGLRQTHRRDGARHDPSEYDSPATRLGI